MDKKSKIYVDSVNGMLDQEAMTNTAKVLLSLTDDPDVVEFHVDHSGHHFAVPTELFDKFMAAVNPPKKRGRPRKAVDSGPAEAAEATEAAEELSMSSHEEVAADSNDFAETDLEE